MAKKSITLDPDNFIRAGVLKFYKFHVVNIRLTRLFKSALFLIKVYLD